MRSTPLRSAPLLLGGVVLAALAGCTATTPTPTGSASPSASAADGLTTCLEGSWSLDVEHLSDTVAGLVDVPGIPMQDFAVAGDGTLDFSADGDVSGALDVRATGALDDGTAFDLPLGADFGGTWSVGQEPGTIAVDDWTYDIAEGSGVDGVELPRPMDFSNLPEIEAECSDDALTLSAGSVPVEVRWVRATD